MIDPFRFVFMADCQLGCYATFSGMSERDIADFAARGMTVAMTPKTTGHDWDARRYEAAVDAANALTADFVVMGGDMVDDALDGDQYADVVRITAGLGVPMHWVPGNHDVAADGKIPSVAGLHRYRERFGADHYTFEHKGATLIVVNTMVWVHAEILPAEWETQLDALRAALADGRRRGGPIIVFGHHPLFTDDHDEDDSYWNVPRTRRHLLLDLLDAHGVTTYLCGHWHRNGGGRYRGVNVVITGAVGYPLGRDPSGFRVVDVMPESITHHYRPLNVPD